MIIENKHLHVSGMHLNVKLKLSILKKEVEREKKYDSKTNFQNVDEYLLIVRVYYEILRSKASY